MNKIKNFFNRKNLLNVFVVGTSFVIAKSLLDMFWDDKKISEIIKSLKISTAIFDVLFYGFLFTIMNFNFFNMKRNIKEQSDHTA